MNIVVIGGGAVGLLVSKLLEDQGHQVTVLIRTPKQPPVLYQSPVGTVELMGGFVSQDWSIVDSADIVVVATKAYHLSDVLPRLVTRKGPIIFLQNGLIKHSVQQVLDSAYVLYGSVDHGVGIEEDMLLHTGDGTIRVGGSSIYREQVEKLAPVIYWEEDIELILLRKAVLNTLINPVTALLDVANGELRTNKSIQQAVIGHYDELIQAFSELEAALTLDDVFELIKRTATNSSSMRRDIQAKRQTEAEYILRPLLQMAEGRKRYLPITNYLYNLILSKGSEPHTKLS